MQHRKRLWALTVVLGIMLGLLGMHTFSADGMGHGPSADHAMSAAAASVHGDTAHGVPAAQAPDHPVPTTMAMACVLALLAALVLLVPPPASVSLRPRLHRLPRGTASVFRTAPLHPPSLIALCISRT